MLTAALGMLLGVACTHPPATSVVTVFAAASLTDAFREVAREFEGEHPNVSVVLSFGSSGQLRTQIVQGARADVFAVASPSETRRLRSDGITAGPDRVFARNRLVIIAPNGLSQPPRELADLARPGLSLVLAAQSVPAGQYAAEVIARASGDPELGPDFAARVDANVRSREPNVRQVAAKVALGQADAAIVYATDVTPEIVGRVQQVGIPELLNVTAEYPLVVLPGGPNAGGGARFADFVMAARGQAVLAKWGFLPGA
jgi:molybdate transport system substrate-binding protein